jgi:hypothetical protein
MFVLLFKAYGLYDRDAKRQPLDRGRRALDLPRASRRHARLWLLFRYSPASGLDMTEGLVFFGIALGAVSSHMRWPAGPAAS